MIKAGKLSQLIKELKLSNGKDQAKAAKKGETSGKEKPLAILMVQPWHRVAKQRITQTFSPDSVISFPPLGEEYGTKGPMIIEADMGGHFVHRMYVDGGSSLEILYEHCFNRFRPEVTIPIQRNHRKARSKENQGSLVYSPRNVKFPMTGRMVTLQSSRIIPLECTMVSGPGVPQPVINQVTEEKIQVAIHPEYLKQTIAIGSTLTEEGQKEMCSLLRRNHDIFAWRPTDMTGVPRHIAEHRLNIHEGCLRVRQKKKGQAPKRNKAIYEEVEKLVDAGIMKEVHYHSWLSNLVMVKKHDDSWRMCVDFKDLNNACPKDGYPLLEIDWKVESLYGYPLECFLDAYKGYHQIKIAKENEEKTTFITNQGILCYSKMPFGLKNNGATYQRLVGKAFQKQIDQNLEVYMDNLVIKSCTEQEVIRDIEETFKTLREINMKLNPQKCTFGMREGKFLGTSVKGQILADFIVERPEDDPQDTPMENEEALSDPWILSTDGSSCIDGSGAGLIITNPKGVEFTYALRFRFDATNNEVEYEALIDGLRVVEQMGVKNLQANVDSRLVANQVNGTYIAKEPGMIKYLEKVHCPVPRNPQQKLTPITSPWLFYKWGIDIVGPFPKGLVCRFGIPGEIISDNGKQIRDNPFKDCNGETSFSLTYETEAMILVEIVMPSLRTAEVDMIKNDEAMEINLDLLEEKKTSFNTSFKPGDLVYRSNEASHVEDGGKLGPK
ncbi:reverse transcriptase domain-containing protein [Tanacetum coccineum]